LGDAADRVAYDRKPGNCPFMCVLDLPMAYAAPVPGV